MTGIEKSNLIINNMDNEKFKKECQSFGIPQLTRNKLYILRLYNDRATLKKDTETHKVFCISSINNQGFIKLKNVANNLNSTYVKSSAFIKNGRAYLEIHLRTIEGEYKAKAMQEVKRSLEIA